MSATPKTPSTPEVSASQLLERCKKDYHVSKEAEERAVVLHLCAAFSTLFPGYRVICDRVFQRGGDTDPVITINCATSNDLLIRIGKFVLYSRRPDSCLQSEPRRPLLPVEVTYHVSENMVRIHECLRNFNRGQKTEKIVTQPIENEKTQELRTLMLIDYVMFNKGEILGNGNRLPAPGFLIKK